MEDPTSVALSLGRMRCVRALGEWQRLQALSRDAWNRCSAPQIRAQISPLAAAAALNLHQWDSLDRFIPHMDESGVESSFYRAILCIHRGEFAPATAHIDRAVAVLDSSLTALVGESYARAYGTIVKVQQLMELQEVISYRTGGDEKKALIRKTWTQRLQGCQRNVEVWHEILSVRSLVVPPRQDIETWLEFSTLCRKSGRLHLSLQVLSNLLGMDPTLFVLQPDTPLPFDHPQMTLACLKHLYSAGYEKEAYNRLCDLVNSDTLNPEAKRMGDSLTPSGVEKLKAQAYLKLGTWQMEMLDSYFLSRDFEGKEISSAAAMRGHTLGGPTGALSASAAAAKAELKLLKSRQYGAVMPQVINYMHAATVCDMQSFRAWHEWAMINFRVVKHWVRSNAAAAAAAGSAGGPDGQPRPAPVITKHIVAAIEGFFRSIWLQAGGDNSRQDVLRLLALWFEHGSIRVVEAALAAGLFGSGAAAGTGAAPAEPQMQGAAGVPLGASRQGCISIDTWLAVIPQIIARIHSPSSAIRSLLHELLTRIGRAHPQALVYPLTVASKSYSEVRQSAALSILNQMRQHSNALVNQALLVSSELVRVAILWHELWHEAIEEASRYWFGQNNVDAMMATLAPMHAMMERGPATMREVAFQQQFGPELQEALALCNQYNKSGRTQVSFLTEAWEIYGECFRKITKVRPTHNTHAAQRGSEGQRHCFFCSIFVSLPLHSRASSTLCIGLISPCAL
jgi:FKBP12-rapamycin complex-associated protein